MRILRILLIFIILIVLFVNTYLPCIKFMNNNFKYILPILIIIIIYILFLLICFKYRKYFQKSLRHLFNTVIPYLNKGNIEYWVDFGTLLGIHRDQDIIIGDNDCDICVWKKDEDKVRPILKQIAKENNLIFEEYDWGGFRLYYNKFFIDIYKARIDNKIDQVIIPTAPNTPIDLLSDFEMANVKLHNKNIIIRQPKKWKELLEFRYTKNWQNRICKWWLGYFSIDEAKISSI